KSGPTTLVLELSGNWRASDVSWRKSIRIRANAGNFSRYLVALPDKEKDGLGIDRADLAFRLIDARGEMQAAGLQKNDILVAFDGKRRVGFRNPQYYPLIEHRCGDMMDITFLRDGKERTVPVRIP